MRTVISLILIILKGLALATAAMLARARAFVAIDSGYATHLRPYP